MKIKDWLYYWFLLIWLPLRYGRKKMKRANKKFKEVLNQLTDYNIPKK